MSRAWNIIQMQGKQPMRRHEKAPCSASPRLVSQRRTGLRAKLNHVQLGRQRAARKRLLRKADHRAAALRPRRLPPAAAQRSRLKALSGLHAKD